MNIQIMRYMLLLTQGMFEKYKNRYSFYSRHPGMGNISIIDLQNTLSNRLRDLQLKQNLAPIKNTLSKAMSGSAKVMSRGSTKFMKGMDSFLNDNDTSEGPSTQQVGKLFSNFSSFWSKKAKEFSKVMEVS